LIFTTKQQHFQKSWVDKHEREGGNFLIESLPSEGTKFWLAG